MTTLPHSPSSYISTTADSIMPVPKIKSTRKRTRRACKRCKTRKVRCDATISNVTCTNCSLDDVECHVEPITRRRRRQSVPHASYGSSSMTSLSATVDIHSKGSHEFAHTDVQWPDYQRPRCDVFPASPPDNQNETDPCRESQSTGHTGPPKAAHETYEGSNNLARLYTDGLPSFIRPLPPRISKAAADFLSSTGALSSPCPELRNSLWQAYVRSVHPFLPLLDLQNFSIIVEPAHISEGQLSLLLFHGVMLAGIYFVDIKYLHNAGYTSRKSCIHDVFEIVKVLYDLDYEQDRICLIQSLLLMTLWYRAPDDHKDPWHYVGLAVALARKVGLHQVSTIAAADSFEQRFLRRLWWCCVMRDYMIGYGMSRPVHLRLRECTVPMLTMDDFDLDCLATALTSSSQPLLDDNDAKERQLAMMCIEQAKLCEIGHIYLELLDSKEAFAQHGAEDSDPTLGSPEDEITLKADEELITWYSELPDECSAKQLSYENTRLEDDILLQHSNLLHMLYHTAVITVHRRYLVPSERHRPGDNSSITAANSRQKVCNSALEVTRMYQILDDKGHLKYLPMHSMPCLLITIIVNLLEIKFAGDNPYPFNVRALSMLIELMRKLRNDVSYMDWSYQFLESACKKANIKMSIGEEPEQTRLDYRSNLQQLEQPLATRDNDAIFRADIPHVFEFTPPPEEDNCALVLPSQSNLELDVNILSICNEPSLRPTNETNDLSPTTLLAMTRWDLPAGYGETINTYFMDMDGSQRNQGPFTPLLLDPRDHLYDNHALDGLDWLYSATGIDSNNDGMEFSLIS